MEHEYKKEDFKRLTWEEYGIILEDLGNKVEHYLAENDVKLSAIVPIIRAAAFPGIYLAYKLKMTRILPIQYKYRVNHGEQVLERLTDLPKATFPMSEKPVFLLVENNTCFGTTAEKAGEYLREIYPDCEIIFVATTCDYSYEKPNIFKTVIIGTVTNECKTISEQEAKEKEIRQKLCLFPWESLEEEFSAVSNEEFRYNQESE